MRLALQSKEPLFLDAISSIFTTTEPFQVVARETNLKDLIESAKKLNVKLLIVDRVGMSPTELQFLQGVRAGGGYIVVMLTQSDSDDNDPSSADAFVSRNRSSSELVSSTKALQEKLPVEIREHKRGYRMGNRLSQREFEVAEFIARGHSNRKISQVSGLREQSVKNLVSVIMRKLKCENRTQVALKILNTEVMPPEE